MAGSWNFKKQEDKVSPESFVVKCINNVIDYDFSVATSTDSKVISDYPERFVWLVNSAESACRGARLIVSTNGSIDFDNLNNEEKDFVEAAKKLFISRDDYSDKTANAIIERKARKLLEEIVFGYYDAKVNEKKNELKELVVKKKIDETKRDLILARFRLQLLIEAAEAKKTIRKEMNQ